MNMLSAKKVRLHGMKSSRWTTKDKLTQYKGIINLYTRDRKILTVDHSIAKKKLGKDLKQLRKDIKANRSDLDNAVQGDRQQLRNSLAEHKDLQLAFQNLPPTRVIDHLHQANFNQRKLLDRMGYKMRQKTQVLINLKLELAELEDRLKYTDTGQIPVEREAQLITGKVQDAILKKEAALSVGHTYNNILNILKKDSLYFDAVLETLKLDSFLQSKCMVRTTELGQLATEYLDDRKQEFKELEKAVKRDMKAREQSLKVVREEVDDLLNNLGLLIRRDDDINIGIIKIPLTDMDYFLQNEIASIEHVLKYLQETTFVSDFSRIFPCLEEQERQRTRLEELLAKCIEDRDNLLKKKKHADLMHDTLNNTMCETTFDYKSTKTQLIEDIQIQTERKHAMKEDNLRLSIILVKIRDALRQLTQNCLIVTVKDEEKKSKRAAIITPKRYSSANLSSSADQLEFEDNILKLLSNLEPKLVTLVNSATTGVMDAEKKEHAYKTFYQLATQIYPYIQYEELVVEDSLISDITVEDPQVPTYNDIKTKSKEMVESCTVNDDLVPMFVPSKKKKSKK